MQICLVTHGFPPLERTGVENYTAALGAALAAAGHSVEIFAPRVGKELPNLSMRREERSGYGLTWLTSNTTPSNQEEALDLPGVAERFGDFLDNERPEVVHFQHLIKLGMGLIEEAQSRGIPAIYTAHDYYPVCHRFTLVRPDMSRCGTIGDPEQCSRCDLALSHLNRVDDLGDYQLGALPDQLDAVRAKELRHILAGRAHLAGFTAQEQADFRERRTRLDARRLETYRRIDLILSPTRFLRDRLIDGGLDAAKIEVLTYGAETADLDRIPRPTRRKGEPVRFGFLGGLSKHKGVHVLVAAFERMGAGAELSIWGDSSDTQYVERVKAAASSAGARWRGSYRRGELGACLTELDVVVVPSTWVENYPFVIREAFAAGRPVISSGIGALPESVRHGVDGLLVEPDNPDALAAAMRRFVDEPGLLAKLVGGIDPVKSIEDQANELLPIYARVHESHETSRDRGTPASLREPNRRYQELSTLPLRELFRSVLGRLTHVKGMLLGKDAIDDEALSFEALASGSHTQVLLRDLRRERKWLKSNEDSLRKRVAWREEELRSLNEENRWLRETIDGAERGIEALRKEAGPLRGTHDALRERVAWREKELKAIAKENEWLRESLDNERESAGALNEENAWLKSTSVSKDEEIAWLKETLESKASESEWLRETLDGVEKEAAWLRESKAGELDSMTAEIARVSRELEDARTEANELRAAVARHEKRVERLVRVASAMQRRDDASDSRDEDQLDAAVRDADARITAMIAELEQRRSAMEDAIEYADRRVAKLLTARTALGRHIASWRSSDNGNAGS